MGCPGNIDFFEVSFTVLINKFNTSGLKTALRAVTVNWS